MKNILQAMADLEKEFHATKDAKDVATTAEIMRIRQQVSNILPLINISFYNCNPFPVLYVLHNCMYAIFYR